MSDLIERSDAGELLKMAIEDSWEPDYANDRLLEIPSVEPEIVRCQDCEYYTASTGLPFKTCEKGIISTPMNIGLDFCSYGVRRKNATNRC